MPPQSQTFTRKLSHLLTVPALLLALLLALLAPALSNRVWVEFGPQQHVLTLNPKLGVHTRLTDEVEPWKVQRSFEMVRELGAPWVWSISSGRAWSRDPGSTTGRTLTSWSITQSTRA